MAGAFEPLEARASTPATTLQETADCDTAALGHSRMLEKEHVLPCVFPHLLSSLAATRGVVR
jgi:hypothetical protein